MANVGGGGPVNLVLLGVSLRMLGLCFIGASTAAIAYFACREIVLRRMRTEKPELFANATAATLLDALMGPSSVFSQGKDLDYPNFHVDPASSIWRYVRLGRICLAAVYVFGTSMAAFGIARTF
jgi:hypothetical protein